MSNYNADSIQIKNFREACRSVPGMYIGTDGQDAAFNCFLEVLNNACFTKGNQVLTKQGYKAIETITDKDYILNQFGKWEKVNYPTSREYTGKGYKLKLKEVDKEITCTDNHKFLASCLNWCKTKTPVRWVEAKDLRVGSEISAPQRNFLLYPVSINYDINKKIILREEWEGLLRNRKPKFKINDSIQITEKVMRLFGLWLGDGSIMVNENGKRINLTFNEEEFNYFWEDFVQDATNTIGFTWNISRVPETHKVELTTSKIEVVELFYYLFGLSHANNKYIPERLLHISETLDWNLFFGYSLADGHFREIKASKNYTSGQFEGVSISKQLMLQFQDLLQSLCIRSSIYLTEHNDTIKNDVWRLYSHNNAWKNINKRSHFSNEDVLQILNKAKFHDQKRHLIYNNIKYKKLFIAEKQEVLLNETVYCLNVNSHSFCCNNVIVHNCDEAMMGRGNIITIKLSDDCDTITCIDNGAGVPHGPNKDTNEVLIELFTSAHSSGKFDTTNYKKVRGCHGIGTSAVCVCSTSFEVWTRRDGAEYYLNFKDGIPQLKEAKFIRNTNETGSTFSFTPDKTIFNITTTNFDYEKIKEELELTSYFIPNIKFILEYKDKKIEFLSKNGLKDFAKNRIKEPLHKSYIYGYKEFDDEVEVEVFAQWTGGKETSYIFSNGALNSDGGTPETGAKTAFTRTINSLSKGDFDADMIRKGLVYIVNIRHPHPIYQNQTKNKIQNSELRGYTQTVFSNAIKDFVARHKNEFDKIVQILTKEQKAEKAAERARQQILNTEKEINNEKKKTVILADKLKDCQIHGFESGSVLAVCEGETN